MAIKINFDLTNNPETPTLILATRSGKKLGQLDAKKIELSDKLNGASEITFVLNKYIDGNLTNLWDEVVDFKLVYCKEWDMWFEIRVEIDEDDEVIKTVFCTQLGQAELSQIMLYDIEINTEEDIARDDYKISILYDPSNTGGSILHRLLEKAPHYSVIHVDSTIAKMQRSFSFNDTSIYDAFQEIAEEIGCLFIFHSNSDSNGNIQRTISVYDLQQYCFGCEYRGEFTDTCPKCGSKNIKNGYGNDTLIFVTADELVANNIQFATDTDSVKNCFKLEAGDDLMTATIRNCNPNGTDYIYYFSDDIKKDMSQELVQKIEDYDKSYKQYYNEYESNINSTLLTKYNTLVDKYIRYNEDLKYIATPVKGYSSLMNAYYNVIDLSLYLRSGMMPTVKMSTTNATEQASLLTKASLSPVAVTNAEIVSLETANSVILSMAKIIVKSTYKVEIGSSSFNSTNKTWTGSFIVTNYSDEEDTATSSTVNIVVNDNVELFVKQKIEKALNKENTEDLSISGLFEKDLVSFGLELKKYALNPLKSFRDACQACIDILIEQGATQEDLYNNLYWPYYQKLAAIDVEMGVREKEISVIDGVYNSENVLITEGLSTHIEKLKIKIQEMLDFKKYLGDKLWLEFCSYRREDKYVNENYISEGLNNVELFDKALEFIEVAENEIYKSAELQHSISTTLNNLLGIEKFKPLVEDFEVGNWIRIQLDGQIYKLRLLDYDIDFDSFSDIPVTFSDVTKIKNGITDVEDILSQASSMTTHYSAVQKQAKQGDEAQGTIDQWISEGLNSALIQIQNNETEDITLTKHGILCRSYDDVTDSHSPEQLKITHNIMAYTSDDWKTVKQAIGKHEYNLYDSSNDTWKSESGYGMSAEFVTAAHITGSTIVGGEIYSSNYHQGTSGSSTDKPKGTYIDLVKGNFALGSGKIVYNDSDNTLTLSDVTIKWSELTDAQKPKVDNIYGLENYLNQLDARIQTYSQEEDPSTYWTTAELKSEHIGDLWFDTENNLTKRWDGTQWVTVTDSDLKALAQSKAQIFTSTPTPPYNVGDLWVEGYTGDIKHCVIARESTDSYQPSDWIKSSKYTDDSSLNDFIDGDYADDLIAINNQIDQKSETWYQSTDPSTSWTTDDDKKKHVGDLWFNTSESKNYMYNASYKWVEVDGVPQDVYDAIDGKASIYTSKPSNGQVGDLLIPSSTFSVVYNSMTYTFIARKIYRCTADNSQFIPTQWSEVAYTDDTTALSAKGIADSAKEIGNKLVNGLGFQETEITGSYVISPVIAGGTLLIGDKTGTYAEITTQGILNASGANIIGDIKAGSVNGGYNFIVDNNSGEIKAGRNTDGTYNFIIDSSGHVTITGSLSIEGGGSSGSGSGTLTDEDKAYLERLKTDTLNYANNASTYASNASTYASNASSYASQALTSKNELIAKVDEVNGKVIFKDIGIGTNNDGSKYFCVDSQGLLTARNAVIYGTVYASAGKFVGEVQATSLSIGGTSVSSSDISNASNAAKTATNYLRFNSSEGLIVTPDTASTSGNRVKINSDGVYLQRWTSSSSVTSVAYFKQNEIGLGFNSDSTEAKICFLNSNSYISNYKNTTLGEDYFRLITPTPLLLQSDSSIVLRVGKQPQNIAELLTMKSISISNSSFNFFAGIDTAITMIGRNISIVGEEKSSTGTITNQYGYIDFGNMDIRINRGNSDNSDTLSKFNSFSVDRDMYFTPSNGVYGYRIVKNESGGNTYYSYNMIRLTGSTTPYICLGDGQIDLRLFGSGIYLGTSATAVTSDKRLKTDISEYTTSQENFFNALRPVSFKYINGTSGRTHFGFIAQEVKEAALSVGLTTQDIASYVEFESEDETLGMECALRYDEFISLNTHMIQKCLKEISDLKAEISELKQSN